MYVKYKTMSDIFAYGCLVKYSIHENCTDFDERVFVPIGLTLTIPNPFSQLC